MNDKVIAPKQFLNRMAEDQVQELGGFSAVPDSEMDLEHPKAAEDVVGTLVEEEIGVFKTMYWLQESISEINNSLGGNALIAAGEAIKKGEEPPQSNDEAVLDQELVSKFFVDMRKFEMSKSLLWMKVCDRIGFHDWTLGIRSRYRVVKIRRNW